MGAGDLERAQVGLHHAALRDDRQEGVSRRERDLTLGVGHVELGDVLRVGRLRAPRPRRAGEDRLAGGDATPSPGFAV